MQKRNAIAAKLKVNPEKSNNRIAKEAKVYDKTVAKVRAGLESTSEIPKLKKTTVADVEARLAKRSKTVKQDARQIESVNVVPLENRLESAALTGDKYVGRDGGPQLQNDGNTRANVEALARGFEAAGIGAALAKPPSIGIVDRAIRLVEQMTKTQRRKLIRRADGILAAAKAAKATETFTVEDELEADEYREAFLLRTADALSLLFTPGDEEVISAAERVVTKWQEFTKVLEGRYGETTKADYQLQSGCSVARSPPSDRSGRLDQRPPTNQSI